MGAVYVINNLLLYLHVSLLGIVPYARLERPLGVLPFFLAVDLDPGEKRTPLTRYQLLGYVNPLAERDIYPLQYNFIFSG